MASCWLHTGRKYLTCLGLLVVRCIRYDSKVYRISQDSYFGRKCLPQHRPSFHVADFLKCLKKLLYCLMNCYSIKIYKQGELKGGEPNSYTRQRILKFALSRSLFSSYKPLQTKSPSCEHLPQTFREHFANNSCDFAVCCEYSTNTLP